MGKRKSGALAGKTKMSERNQVSAADAAVINAIDWDKVALQKVIHAANQRRLGGPLTKWLAEEGWNLGKFVVKENFVVDTSRRAKVKISGLGSNFRNWFLNTVENLPPVGKLDQFILPESMYDKDIVVKLGGVAKAITSMGKVSGLMELQPEGPESDPGQLHTDGKANIFYVPQTVTKLADTKFSYVDLNGKTVVEELKDPQYLFEVAGQCCVLRPVSVFWRVGGWDVGADSVGGPSRWGAGDRAFSRDSALKSSETLATAQA